MPTRKRRRDDALNRHLPGFTNTYQGINRAVGKALHRYAMIADGDRIAVGLSGGKDSMTLLSALRERQGRAPIDFHIFPIYIDPGFPGGFASELSHWCRSEGIALVVEQTDHGLVAHGPQNRENPCFLCSRLRRKRLFEIGDKLGCNKLALGHNKDDLIETFFLNICYAGEISTMVPSQSFFNGRFTVIRPLAFVEEATIRRFARESAFPRFDNPCPTAGVSKRREIKELLATLYGKNRKIKGNIFRAMSHVKLDYLLK
jgi:tRNA 2-thiocytidine biosynthesis protein TtcA